MKTNLSSQISTLYVRLRYDAPVPYEYISLNCFGKRSHNIYEYARVFAISAVKERNINPKTRRL